MFKMSMIRNTTGAGLIMAMMGLTALSGAAYVISTQMSDSDKILQRDARIESYRELVGMIRNNLYAGNNCTEALGKTPAKAGVALSASGLSLTGSIESGDMLNFQMKLNSSVYNLGLTSPGQMFTRNGIRVNEIRFKLEDQVRNEVRIIGDAVNKKAAFANMIIIPENKSINILKKDLAGNYVYKDLFIKLFVYYEDDGSGTKIYSCSDPSSEAAFCSISLKGAYTHDLTKKSEERCQPDMQCFSHKTGISPVGSACPEPFIATPVGRNFQICNWCPPTPASEGSVLTGIDSINVMDMDFEADDGTEVTCSEAGYSGLGPQDSKEAREDYEGYIGYLTNDQYNANAGCLNYIPPSPTPTPTPSPSPTTGGSGGGGGGGGGDGGEQGGAGNCFIAGTKVSMADGSFKSIEEIQTGEKVLTYDESKKMKLNSEVVKVFHHEKAESILFTFTFDNGKKVTSNDVHPFFILETRDYLSAQMIYDSWRPGKTMSLLNAKGQKVYIKNIQKTLKEVPLYNLHVRGRYDNQESEVNINHNYFANDVLVHNRKQVSY
jgi:hypothetical protein